MKQILYVCLLVGALLADSADLSGRWEGRISMPNTQTEVQINLSRDAKGNFSGSLESGGLAGAVLQKIAFDGTAVEFRAREDQRFAGELSADGASISGSFYIAGYPLPFLLRRTGPAHALDVVQTEDIQGSWTGKIVAGGKEERVTLEASQGLYLALPDEGGLKISVTSVTRSNLDLTFDIGGGFATLTARLVGDELVGTYRAGELSLPLTLKKD